VIKSQFYNHMNSPKPPAGAGQALTASQRGANRFTPPSFVPPWCEGQGGMST